MNFSEHAEAVDLAGQPCAAGHLPHIAGAEERPLLGVEQTSHGHAATSANDPKRTCARQMVGWEAARKSVWRRGEGTLLDQAGDATEYKLHAKGLS